jgi:hypothetical protein
VRIIICLSLVGGVLGFLPFNRHPAKIFMGDAGSMLLGFVTAALMILFAETIPRWWMASIVIFGLPILDTATALVRRLVNKRPLFVSDRGHIYDQLIDRGIPLRNTRRPFVCPSGHVRPHRSDHEPDSHALCLGRIYYRYPRLCDCHLEKGVFENARPPRRHPKERTPG